MFEIKVNGKQSESYLVVAKDVIKIPMEDLTCIINKAPKISTTMSINMDQIMKMFGKDR